MRGTREGPPCCAAADDADEPELTREEKLAALRAMQEELEAELAATKARIEVLNGWGQRTES